MRPRKQFTLADYRKFDWTENTGIIKHFFLEIADNNNRINSLIIFAD